MRSSRCCLYRHIALLAFLPLSVACDNGADSVTEPEPDPKTPITLACASPAILDGTPDWSNPRFVGFIVTYHEGFDPVEETARLSARHGFTPRFVYQYALRGFSAMLTPEALSGVLCEASVRRVAADYVDNVLASATGS